MVSPFHPSHQPVEWAAVIGVAFVAALWDVRTGRIPNWLTGLMFLAGIAWCACTGGAARLGDGLEAGALISLPYVLLFLFAGGGAADAKLMAALGVWLGVHDGIALLLAVLIAGAVVGLGYAVTKRRTANVVANLSLILLGMKRSIVGRRSWTEATSLFPNHDLMLKVPYGLSIFAGACVAAAGSLVWHAW